MVLFASSDRKGRISPLPTFTNSMDEKLYLSRRSSTWYTPVALPFPFIRDRRLRVYIPIPPRFYYQIQAQYSRRRHVSLLFLTALTVFGILTVVIRGRSGGGGWRQPFSDPPTLVFAPDDIRHIWEWEIASGHYQSTRPIPKHVGLSSAPQNPGIPRSVKPITGTLPDRFKAPDARVLGDAVEYSLGAGLERVYLDIQSQPPYISYPPRPPPGSIADLDMVMEHCDFQTQKYVRDCLEVMRSGGGLDAGRRYRIGIPDRWKYIYREDVNSSEPVHTSYIPPIGLGSLETRPARKDELKPGYNYVDSGSLEPHLRLPAPVPYKSQSTPANLCDPDHPRVFHMFWVGPFTDKPYMAIMSYLYTQNTGLHLPMDEAASSNTVCRPKLWMWISIGPAASMPNQHALTDMYNTLAKNPWSSPFLHPRFKNIIEFKLWNTTEQLDSIPEISSEWRTIPALFNSGGYKYAGKKEQSESLAVQSAQYNVDLSDDDETKAADPSPTRAVKADQKNMYNMVGSSSSTEIDKLAVILSDMVRFILCHRFGGTYLDTDTLLLRDWEELWGWKGAFAYRWSRLQVYNTAALRMNKGSALGSFLFRTALRNDLDFHPMTVSRYMKDAHLEGLLLRLPDALFDSAWLNTEDYQRDRPPFPYFTEFGHLFHSPKTQNSQPLATGFEGFFRGAYSYHYHNSWWKAFDPARNYPDLGFRFIAGETEAKARLNAGKMGATLTSSSGRAAGPSDGIDDTQDLEWAAILKRTFESYIRGEQPNMYGEWLTWT